MELGAMPARHVQLGLAYATYKARQEAKAHEEAKKKAERESKSTKGRRR